jgi:hypothetical protein
MSLILVIERSLNIFHPQRQLVHAMPTPSTPFHDSTFSKPPSFIFSSDCGNVSFITTHHSQPYHDRCRRTPHLHFFSRHLLITDVLLVFFTPHTFDSGPHSQIQAGSEYITWNEPSPPFGSVVQILWDSSFTPSSVSLPMSSKSPSSTPLRCLFKSFKPHRDLLCSTSLPCSNPWRLHLYLYPHIS